VSWRVFALALLALVALMGTLRRADAHAVGLSRGDYVASGGAVMATMVFARGELTAAVPSLDANGDGALDDWEVQRARAALEGTVTAQIIVRGDSEECPGTLARATLTEQDGLELVAMYTCRRAPSKVTIELALLGSFAHGHRHLVRLAAGSAVVDDVLFRGHASAEIETGGQSAPGQGAARRYSRTVGFVAFPLMGVEHILTGYDHLLFLFGLILVGGRVRALAGVVTAFTLAHSITLALAAFGVLTPPSRIVEPAIALSIAYVGVENFFVKNAEKRWKITFPFGLVHGFGFAAALHNIELPRTQIPVALVSFNLGVELGQLGVMAAVLPLVLWARKNRWIEIRGVPALSACITLVGLFWFVERIARSG
jgi:hydrogenase/urease accessory protein HupE